MACVRQLCICESYVFICICGKITEKIAERTNPMRVVFRFYAGLHFVREIRWRE